jgi:Holliday junction DNA helicase RuvA
LIGRLTGRIVEEGADGGLVIDVGGVGYEVAAPLGTVGRLSADPDGEVTVWVHTHLREDALLLFGFASRGERAVFRQLIGISSIGPKIAMSILGSMAIGDLASAVARGETSRLTKVPGVGKKTAERIVLELKDKLLAEAPATTAPLQPSPRATPRGEKAELLQGALTRMGYRPAEAERAVAQLGGRVDEAPLADLVREALAILAP